MGEEWRNARREVDKKLAARVARVIRRGQAYASSIGSKAACKVLNRKK
jgi:hypothetical protein